MTSEKEFLNLSDEEKFKHAAPIYQAKYDEYRAAGGGLSVQEWLCQTAPAMFNLWQQRRVKRSSVWNLTRAQTIKLAKANSGGGI